MTGQADSQGLTRTPTASFQGVRARETQPCRQAKNFRQPLQPFGTQNLPSFPRRRPSGSLSLLLSILPRYICWGLPYDTKL